MNRPRLLFATLLPPYLGLRFEDAILARLVEEYRREFSGMYDLRLLLASAHAEVLEEARAIVESAAVPIECLHVPFEMQENFDTRRAHEIAIGKQFLLRHLVPDTFDYLLYIDSDVYVSFADYHRLIPLLQRPLQFVNIPYVCYGTHRVGPNQLGAYIHRAELLRKIDYSGPVYCPVIRKGKLSLRRADDCAARLCMIRRGAREIRAARSGISFATRHYSGKGTYDLYDGGAITRHWNAEGWLGFDPLISRTAMHLEACAALTRFAARVGARSALVVDGGSGNAIGSVAAAGAEEILVLANETAASRTIQRICERFSRCAMSFHQFPLESIDATRTDALRDLRQRQFDLAVLDGPGDDPAQRIAVAMQVDARHYAFYKGERDAAAIRQFIHYKRMQGLPCNVARMAISDGLTIVSVDSGERAFEGHSRKREIEKRRTARR